jgi:hypothetical protein
MKPFPLPEELTVADPVEIWVRDKRTGEEKTLRLGEFRAVWRKGITDGGRLTEGRAPRGSNPWVRCVSIDSPCGH